jgi:hypothetical protein
VEKDIPPAEKRSKADRLRSCSRLLQEFPLERLPTQAEWDEATLELTQDDFDHLRKMARGHLERAVAAAEEADGAEAAEEGRAAVLLWPRDAAWAREVVTALRAAPWKGIDAEGWFVLVGRRLGKRKPSKLPKWLIPLAVALAAVPLGVWAAFSLGPGLVLGHPVSRVQGPRSLEASFDTQGVKTNIQVAQSRLLIFPDATVAELSAWVTFPEHRVDLWEGTVSVLDPQGKTLTSRDVTFHSSSEAPLEAGQGLPVFEQFDAWPWFDQVASFQVITTRILAQPAHPADRVEMALGGVEALTEGYGLKVWVKDSRWVDRFASKVHTFTFEIENTGLKPFAQLQLALVWRNDQGKTLKTLVFRPVSPFRTALPSGGKLGWTQESVFDTEVFSWPAGGEPHPSLELRQWQ